MNETVQERAGGSHDYRTRLYERYATAGMSSAAQDVKAPFWRKIATLLPTDPAARIYELGAGAGDLLGYLRKQGYIHTSGVDGSVEQVALAAQNGNDVELGSALEALHRFGNAELDAIVAIDLLEHLTKPEVFELLDECLRALKPGGRIIIHTVNADSPFFGTVRYGDFTHETSFTRVSMAQVLTTIGFRKVSSTEDRPLVHGLKSGLRAIIWEVVRAAAVVVLAAETGLLDRGRILSQNFMTVAYK